MLVIDLKHKTCRSESALWLRRAWELQAAFHNSVIGKLASSPTCIGPIFARFVLTNKRLNVAKRTNRTMGADWPIKTASTSDARVKGGILALFPVLKGRALQQLSKPKPFSTESHLWFTCNNRLAKCLKTIKKLSETPYGLTRAQVAGHFGALKSRKPTHSVRLKAICYYRFDNGAHR